MRLYQKSAYFSAFGLLSLISVAQGAQLCSFSIIKNRGDELNPDYKIIASRVFHTPTGGSAMGLRRGLHRESPDSEIAYEFYANAIEGQEALELSFFRISGIGKEKHLLGRVQMDHEPNAHAARLETIQGYEVLTTCLARSELSD